MVRNLISWLSSFFLGIAFIFIVSPVLLYWFIHGDYERYIWIINGPYPFSHLGGGPFQLWIGIGLIVSGLIFIILSLLLSEFSKRLTKES